MATATVTSFRGQFPEFASESDYTDEYVSRFLTVALAIHSIDVLTTNYCLAHLLALDSAEGLSAMDSPSLALDGGSGVVTEEQTGPSKAKYKVQDDPFFARTSYGRMFLMLESRNPGLVMTARMVA